MDPNQVSEISVRRRRQRHSGLELLPKARAMRPDVPMIMITAYGDASPSAKRSRAVPSRC